MPSSSTSLQTDEKNKIKKAIQSGKIVAAAPARIYYAYPNPNVWSYGGVEGALVFGVQDNGYWLRLVDLGGTRGVIWDHEFYDDFEWYQDRTFFYSFPGDDCMIGIAFSDEGEASALNKKVINRKKYAAKSSKSRSSLRNSTIGMPSMPSLNLSPSSKDKNKDGDSKEKKKKKRGFGFFDKSMISGPSSFKHVAHMGMDSDKGFTSENVDPTWSRLLGQLQGMGISKSQIENNKDFIEDFVRDAESGNTSSLPPPPPPMGQQKTKRKEAPAAPKSRTAGLVDSVDDTPSAPPPDRPPPPPPMPGAAAPSRPGVPAPPPPPPGVGSAVPGRPTGAPPPPPPPPGGSSAPPAPPPPPPPGGRGSAPPPPPPPGAPPRPPGGAPPAPPPPSQSRGSAPPPPPPPGGRAPPPPAPGTPAPPPPPGASQPAASQNGHGDLLASIRSAGGIGTLRKVEDTPSGPASARAETPTATGGGATAEPGNLASALAAALTVRRAGTGDSDDDTDSDDEWDN